MLNAIMFMSRNRRTGFTNSPLVMFHNLIFLLTLRFAIWRSNDVCHNRLLDARKVLAMLKLYLVLLAELNVGPCKTACETTGASTGLVRRAGAGAVVVFAIARVVAGADNLANQIGHVHLDVEFA